MTGESYSGQHMTPAPAPEQSRGTCLHWVFHFIVLPMLFTLAIIGIVGLASIFLSPGGYYDGNSLDALRSSMPIAMGILFVFALLCVFTFAGLFGWRKWSLVTLVVLLVMLIAGCIAVSWAAWSFLGAHGALMAQVDPGLAAVLGYVRIGGIIVAVIALLFLVYYARRSRMFVTAAELREQRKLVSYDQ